MEKVEIYKMYRGMGIKAVDALMLANIVRRHKLPPLMLYGFIVLGGA